MASVVQGIRELVDHEADLSRQLHEVARITWPRWVLYGVGADER